MSEQIIDKNDIVGVEAKHITYVVDANGGNHDMHFVKEVVHLKDKSTIRRLTKVHDYKRPFWITHKGCRNHKEKKDYEFEKNLQKYSCNQVSLARSIAKALGDYSMGPNPRLKQLARSPYLYGTDISSSCLLKNDYREAFPGLISKNTLAGGDIETNVYEDENDGQIICMSVTHKKHVYLAYLKHWVKDLKDPIQETFDELERIPELVSLRNGRKLEIEIEVVDSPADIVINCLRRLHTWKPDFFVFWNIDFDMSRIIRTLENYGVEPKDVFSDPSVPPNFKYFNYYHDLAMTTTASGVTKSKGPEDQWHWVTAPATFQCIDAMSTYRVTRLAKGKDSSYALDAILKKELSMDESEIITNEEDFNNFTNTLKRILNERPGSHPYYFISTEDKDGEPQWESVDSLTYGDNVQDGYRVRFTLNFGKLKFAETDHLNGIEWHREMQKNHKVRYGLYNIIDSIRLEQLDEKTNDLSSSISAFSDSSEYKIFNSNPKRLCNSMHFWYQKRPEPCVIGSSSDQMVHELDSYVIGTDGWIITLPTYMAGPNGMKCIKDLPDYPTYLYSHIAD